MRERGRIRLDRRRHRSRKLRNAVQSALLFAGMLLLLAACGWAVAGVEGVIWSVALCAFGLGVGAQMSPRFMLRLFGAVPLSAEEAPEVHRIVGILAARAGLARPPRLYLVPSPTLNAFSVGRRDAGAIAITYGLLRNLSLRELAGVLAHELSHIRNNDMWVMGLADMISRLTRAMSLAGMLLLAVNVPLLAIGQAQISWLLVLLLIFAPTFVSLLQLALSRTREFDADLDAAALTADPAGLAAALRKLELQSGRFWESILLPGRRSPDPSLLRTHPATAERIRRLLELPAPGPLAMPELAAETQAYRGAASWPAAERPRWRISGLWY